MLLEVFGVRDWDAGVGERWCGVVEVHFGYVVVEVVDVELGGEVGGAVGGERVVRTRDVVVECGF